MGEVTKFVYVGRMAVDISVLGGSKNRYHTKEGGIDLKEDGPVIGWVVLIIVIEAGSSDLW
jgi:hypothetical protein